MTFDLGWPWTDLVQGHYNYTQIFRYRCMEYNVQHWADTRSIERISCWTKDEQEETEWCGGMMAETTGNCRQSSVLKHAAIFVTFGWQLCMLGICVIEVAELCDFFFCLRRRKDTFFYTYTCNYLLPMLYSTPRNVDVKHLSNPHSVIRLRDGSLQACLSACKSQYQWI